MNSIEKVLRFRKGFNEVRQGDIFFEKKKSLYVPVRDWVQI